MIHYAGNQYKDQKTFEMLWWITHCRNIINNMILWKWVENKKDRELYITVPVLMKVTSAMGLIQHKSVATPAIRNKARGFPLWHILVKKPINNGHAVDKSAS